MATSHHTGQRLSFDSVLCTVRYIGPVAGTEKDWLGVEWDDPTRGKHDGEHKGVRYFTCRSRSKTVASFIRSSRAADSAQSFVEAVHEKYVLGFTGRKDVDALDLTKEIQISGKTVHEVGFDKIRAKQAQLHELKIVLVDGLRIDSAEPTSKSVRDVCPRIVELDLSRNLFESCREIMKICAELDSLRSLRLNGNRLQIISDEFSPEISQKAFTGISELSVDETLFTWEEISLLVPEFTTLKSLSASANDLLSLPIKQPLSSFPPSLKNITLEYNAFTSLSDISTLTQITSLETLHLKGNQIKTITNGSTKTPKFGTQLYYIDLSYNDIQSWTFIDALPDVFSGMVALRISNNPVYNIVTKPGDTAASIDESYMLTLARLGNLKSLNFSTITVADRTNAEMFYLSRIAKAMAEVPEAEEYKVAVQHRRFAELCDIYGPPTVLRASRMMNPDLLESRLIRFTFYLPSPSSVPGKASEQDAEIIKVQEIPKGFDVYRVKGIVGRLFGLRPMRLRLIWETGEWDPVAGYEEDGGEDDDDDDDENELDDDQNNQAEPPAAQSADTQGKFMKREIELEDSTRQIGYCVDGMEAKVRIELR